MAWSSATLMPQSWVASKIKEATGGNFTRQALTNAIVPSATGNAPKPGKAGPAITNVVPKSTSGGTGAAPAINSTVPKSTSGGNSAFAVDPAATATQSSNTPPFLQGGNQSTSPDMDFLSMLLEALGGGKQDPGLVAAQTQLATEQSAQVARANAEARKRDEFKEQTDYLNRNLKDAAKYSGTTRDRLMEYYGDRQKVLQRDGEVNWLNMPETTFRTARRGWTGPAMPSPGFGF